VKPLDTSVLTRIMGSPVSRVRTVDAVSPSDIRRWAQALHHPNPLHYDSGFASRSRHGQLVASPSFPLACNIHHGLTPALAGHIPGTEMIMLGDEWWLSGTRILPGDRVTVEHTPYDYATTETKRWGPAVIQRGDNHYVNDRGATVATQRSSVLRFMRPEQRREPQPSVDPIDPVFTQEELSAVATLKDEYARGIAGLGHAARDAASVATGDELPTKAIGPHTLVSFTAEHHAYLMNTWRALDHQQLMNDATAPDQQVAPFSTMDPELSDPAVGSGHLFTEHAHRIGMARPPGFGVALSAWALDYLGDWAGEWGRVKHLRVQLRGIHLCGDLTYLRGKVTAVSQADGLVEITLVTTNHQGSVLAEAVADLVLAPIGFSGA
jgi:hypothetical protein